MKLKKISIANTRSFLERQVLILDGGITIIIGPNGGGKTNLLDAVMSVLRRNLFGSSYPTLTSGPDQQAQYHFQINDLNTMIMEKHSSALNEPQMIDVEIEVTESDVENMKAMQRDAQKLSELAATRYGNLNLASVTTWALDDLPAGKVLTYHIRDGNLLTDHTPQQSHFLDYLQLYEREKRIREDFGFAQLSLPLLYLPVNRAANGFPSTVALANHNESDTKRSLDVANSRFVGNYVALAIGRLAKKHRLLLEEDKGRAQENFDKDPNIQQLTNSLEELGYGWTLEGTNPMNNQYSVRLFKQGTSFLVSAASSGERELLTYLFAIFGLNVRDALVVIDEPELHLHPKWQHLLLNMFVTLARTTGNHFLIATHSPTFISPDSIQYVSRVSSVDQKSRIQRLDHGALPDTKHLLNIINSQNNEKLFFADAVVLVEGISDRLIFQKLLDLFSGRAEFKPTIEVIDVGGKGFFAAYKKLLAACQIPFSLIADRDYIEQIGTQELKALFKVNSKEIKIDVLDNIKSIDAATLVESIESAIQDGNWDNAREIWDYIKSRRREMRVDLDADELKKVNDFFDASSLTGIHLLRHGAIEAYLPAGHMKKDLEKIISLSVKPDLWDQLHADRRDELKQICEAIWNAHRANNA